MSEVGVVGLPMVCPRRILPLTDVFKLPKEDMWRGDKTCSYCGSLHPSEFFKAIEEGLEITPTDKNYKVYVAGNKKFYFKHLSVDQQKQFIELINKGAVNVGYPGYFYTLPYFCQRVKEPEEVVT